MSTILMNSAMMPQPGIYTARKISEDEFCERLHAAPFQSFVGYESTATHIQQIAAVRVAINRSETRLHDGDVILVCRLNFRLADPKRKADRNYVPARSDYEYMLITFQEG